MRLLSCTVQITSGDVRINIPVILGSNCNEELSLEQSDVDALNLTQTESRIVKYSDGSSVTVNVFPDIILELSLSDGSFIQAAVVPISFHRIDDDRVGVLCTSRRLGSIALEKLGLKLDYRSKKLIKNNN
jgi:hypothetical protein